jgi:DNA-binding transcriptional LysR family regulator
MQLRDGRLGIGFARHYAIEPDLETLCVAQEPLFVAMGVDGKNHKGVERRSWREAIAEGRLILFPQIGRPSFADEVLKLVRVLELEPPQLDVAEDVFAALALVQIVDAVSIVPESVAKLHWGRLHFIKIDHPSAFSPVSCMFLRRERPAVVDAFLSMLSTKATALPHNV